MRRYPSPKTYLGESVHQIHNTLTRRSVIKAGGALCVTSLLPFEATAAKRVRVPEVYRYYADKHSVPAELLYSIAHVESYNPKTKSICHYAMNFNRTPYYFNSEEELLVNAKYLLENGYQNFDVGPVQVNWYWHQKKFNSIDSAVNAHTNLDVGTAYLKEKLDSNGDWLTAAGKYHSPSDRNAARNYSKKVLGWYKRLGYA